MDYDTKQNIEQEQEHCKRIAQERFLESMIGHRLVREVKEMSQEEQQEDAFDPLNIDNLLEIDYSDCAESNDEEEMETEEEDEGYVTDDEDDDDDDDDDPEEEDEDDEDDVDILEEDEDEVYGDDDEEEDNVRTSTVTENVTDKVTSIPCFKSNPTAKSKRKRRPEADVKGHFDNYRQRLRALDDSVWNSVDGAYLTDYRLPIQMQDDPNHFVHVIFDVAQEKNIVFKGVVDATKKAGKFVDQSIDRNEEQVIFIGKPNRAYKRHAFALTKQDSQ